MRASNKYSGIIGIMAILVLVVLTSGCTSITGIINDVVNPGNYPIDTSYNITNNISTKTFSHAGISFKYPSSWYVYTDDTSEYDMIIATKGHAFNGVQFQIQTIPNNGTPESTDIQIHETFMPGWNRVATYNLTVANKTAYETIYSVNDSHFSELMRIVHITFVKNDKEYSVTLQAPDKDFDKEKPNFGVILNSIKVL